mgnify:CR=1 FL=1
MSPAWLKRDVSEHPSRFPFATVASALPEAKLSGPRSLALTRSEVLTADERLVVTALLGLAGPSSPLPAAMAQELSLLPPASAAAGLHQAIEDRLLRLLHQALTRRAVDDPVGHLQTLARLAGPLAPPDGWIAGRVCDGPSADALAQRVAVAAGCAVSVHAATGGELPLGPGADSHLGSARLGQSQTLGVSVSSPAFGCSIIIGPVSAEAAQDMRPGGKRYDAVRAAVERGLPLGVSCRLELLVAVGPATPLGSGALGGGARLDGSGDLVVGETLDPGSHRLSA